MRDGAAEPILVIKLGALGDFVQALAPFAAIRGHHRAAHITLLTTEPYVDLAQASGYFNAVWVDERPRAVKTGKWLALRRQLRVGGFRRIYDLQTSGRSSSYFQLFWPGPYPEWSGIAHGCSHPHANPRRNLMHTIERQAEQLRMAGIPEVPPPDLSWAQADIGRFGVGSRYALLVPGGAAHRPGKRWPWKRFAELARRLASAGIKPVLLGAEADAEVLSAIGGACPEALCLTGRTTFSDIAVLARDAVCAIGNDTGPMHLIAVAGCSCVVLFSEESDPALCAPRGPNVAILRRHPLGDLPVDEITAILALENT